MANCLSLCFLLIFLPFSKQCCMPKEMEGNQEIIQLIHRNTSDGGNIISYITSYISYDITNQRLATISTTSLDDGTTQHRTIAFYSNSTSYTISGDSCFKLTLPPLQTYENCVPVKHWKFLRTAIISKSLTAPAKKTSDCSSVNTPSNRTSNTYAFSFQGISQEYHVDENCVIYEQSSSGVINGQQVDMLLEMSNVTLGIKDASVFSLPSLCDNVTEIDVNLTQYTQLANTFGRRSLPFITL